MAILLSLFKFFCSLKLAVATLSAMILLFAIGTFYEASFGREAAKEVIYDSIYMNVLLSLLALNIIAVMLDRLPWKKRHLGFLLAHFGIIFVIAGAFITRFYGLDGYIRLSQGEQSQYITGGHIFLNVYASFDGANVHPLYREKVWFFRHPPTLKKPYSVKLGPSTLKITHFYPSATVKESYKPSKRGGTALRFLIEGSQAKTVRWLFRPPYQEKTELSLGLGQIVLLKSPHDLNQTGRRPTGSGQAESAPRVLPFEKDATFEVFPSYSVNLNREFSNKISINNNGKNILLLRPFAKGLKYQLIKSGKIKQEGFLKKGSVLKTGWMDLKFQLLEYWPKALPHRVFTPVDTINDQSGPAIQVALSPTTQGERWMGLNSQLFFFDEDKVFIVAYGYEKQKLNFALKLKKFKVLHYPFSRKARSYESEVQVDGDQSFVISMNQPLKWGAYTIYQSGFEENERGEPVASVFSVNKDPGRFIKYFGSLLIVLGICVLFIRRNKRKRRSFVSDEKS